MAAHNRAVDRKQLPLVFVVEDNDTDRKLIRVMVELEGYAVSTAASAEEALAAAETLTPRLWLVDIDLPGISGLALTGRLRASARFRTTPIVAMSSTAGSDAAARAAAAGCDGFLRKPVDVASFPATLARWAAAPNRGG